MFTAPFQQATQAFSSLRASVKFNSGLRQAIAAGQLQLPATVSPPPRHDEWCVAEHCGVVTRIYSIYESLVHDLIAEWLSYYSLHTRYSALPERLLRAHRNGIGRILSNYEGRRFRDLLLPTVISDFGNALADRGVYNILPEAFLLHDRNLRLQELAEILTDCGLPVDINEWIKEHPQLRRHFESSPLDANAAKVVTDLIDYRNEAAHASGNVDDILGEPTLLAYIDCFDCICRVLYQAFCSAGLDIKVAHEHWNKLGQITMVTKKDATICVAALRAGTVRQGTQIYFRGKRCCFPATIESVQLDGQTRESVTCVENREVGLKVNVELLKGLDVFAQAAVEAAPQERETPEPVHDAPVQQLNETTAVGVG